MNGCVSDFFFDFYLVLEIWFLELRKNKNQEPRFQGPNKLKIKNPNQEYS
jgi:hypothetical protein